MGSVTSSHTLEQARDARAAAWSFAFDCYARKRAIESAREPDRSSDAERVGNTEGVGHVEQRPDRPA